MELVTEEYKLKTLIEVAKDEIARYKARIKELKKDVIKLQKVVVIGGHGSEWFKWRFENEVEDATEALKESEDG